MAYAFALKNPTSVSENEIDQTPSCTLIGTSRHDALASCHLPVCPWTISRRNVLPRPRFVRKRACQPLGSGPFSPKPKRKESWSPTKRTRRSPGPGVMTSGSIVRFDCVADYSGLSVRRIVNELRLGNADPSLPAPEG